MCSNFTHCFRFNDGEKVIIKKFIKKNRTKISNQINELFDFGLS